MLLSFDRLSASTIVPCPRLTLVSACLKRTAGECACCRHGVSKVSIADTAVVFFAIVLMFYFYCFIFVSLCVRSSASGTMSGASQHCLHGGRVFANLKEKILFLFVIFVCFSVSASRHPEQRCLSGASIRRTMSCIGPFLD